jgi:hypothetical protein
MVGKTPMKIIRHPDLPPPASRPIKHFDGRSPGVHHNPTPSTPPTPSNEEAAKAVRIASSPGGINPKQQNF